MNTFYPSNDYRNYLRHYNAKVTKRRNPVKNGMLDDPRERYRTESSESDNSNSVTEEQWRWDHEKAPHPLRPVVGFKREYSGVQASGGRRKHTSESRRRKHTLGKF